MSLAYALKISKPTNSVSAWSVHKTVIVAEGFHLQFFFKLYNLSPSFAAKDNFCLSSKLITVKLHACRGFTTYDWQRFIVVLSISRFCLIFTRNKFCSVGNASKEVGINTIVFLPIYLSCSILFVRAFQQNRVWARLLYLSSIMNFDISTVKRLIMGVKSF